MLAVSASLVLGSKGLGSCRTADLGRGRELEEVTGAGCIYGTVQRLEGKRRRETHPSNDWNAAAMQNKTPGKTKLSLGLWFKEQATG